MKRLSGGGEFFSRNFVTHGMDQLFREGLLRLSGKSDQAVFELTQAAKTRASTQRDGNQYRVVFTISGTQPARRSTASTIIALPRRCMCG